ncbi:MAG: hypothetical protein COB03_03230 [Alteromonas sp.]|nr:MAG: hypothetical protein COB03_03230 [Alteromonas sp.]
MQHAEQVIKLNDHRPIVKADIENGFDRLAHELTNALAKNHASLSGCEYQILFALISKTFRFHKKDDWIANVQLSEITGMSEAHVSKIVRSLNAKNVIRKDGKKTGINPVISEWKINQSVKKSTQKKSTNRFLEINQSVQEINQSVEKTQPIRPPQKKETITKEINTKEKGNKKPSVKSEILSMDIPRSLSFDMWVNWVENRAENKKPMTVRSAKMQIKRLEAWQAKGHNLDEIIQTSIANNYQGLFEPNKPANRAVSFSERRTQNNIEVLSSFIAEGESNRD